MCKDYFFLSAFIFVLLLLSCSDSENIVTFNRDEVIRLLSNDSSKTWLRKNYSENDQQIELEECSLKTETIYKHRNDSMIYTISTIDQFCDTVILLDSGLWDVAEDGSFTGRIDKIIYYSGEDTLAKEILEITSLFLRLQRSKGETSYEEFFETTY